jgi:DNA excision repair protein ERCC-4
MTRRQDLYRQGGLFSVTSRILVVDMLLSDIPIELISGILVLHADRYDMYRYRTLSKFRCRVTPQSTEAFIIRLFREKNSDAFLKAFTDEPEQLTVGFSPLKDVMKELQVRNVHIYPRCVPTSSVSLSGFMISRKIPRRCSSVIGKT